MRVFHGIIRNNDGQHDGHQLRVLIQTTRAYQPPALAGMDTTSATELRVRRKLDYILLPFLAFFLVNSLDRSNIGNSETANFTKDAGLRPEDLNIAVSLFFATFVALQPVGAILGRKYGMRRWAAATMLIWGLLTTLHVWVRAAWQLYILRILIGALEAGFYPTAVAFLASFYTRFEYAKRLGVFYGQYAVASAVGGILAFAIFSHIPPSTDADPELMLHVWKPWQVLFLLEGCLTMAVAVIGFFYLPWGPSDAWFLSPSERTMACERIARDRNQSLSIPQKQSVPDDVMTVHDEAVGVDEEARGLLPGSRSATLHDTAQQDDAASGAGLTLHDIYAALTDWKVWYLLVLNILSAIPAAAFTVFLPLVMKGLGLTARWANLMVAPPFLAGACLLWTFTWWSDRRQDRLIPILWGLAILLIGLTGAVMFPADALIPRYVALCVLMGGGFIASPLTIAWLSGNIEPPGKRAVVLGINGWGNLAGIFSSLLFSPAFRPDYTLPFFVTSALVLVAFLGFWTFRRLLIRENARRSEILERMTDDADLDDAHAQGFLQGILTSAMRKRWPAFETPKGAYGDNKLTYRYSL